MKRKWINSSNFLFIIIY